MADPGLGMASLSASLVARAYEKAAASAIGPVEPIEAFRVASASPVISILHAGDPASDPVLRENVQLKGNDNIIFYSRNASPLANIYCSGSRNVVYVGENCNVSGLIVHLLGDDGVIFIGAHTTARSSVIQLYGTHATAVIGENCVLCPKALVTNSDTHGIFDLGSGQRINRERDVHVGSNVYLGSEVRVGKGAVIGDGTAVMDRSIVIGRLEPRSLYWGVPAKLWQSDIRWFHDCDVRPTLEESLAAEAQRLMRPVTAYEPAPDLVG